MQVEALCLPAWLGGALGFAPPNDVRPPNVVPEEPLLAQNRNPVKPSDRPSLVPESETLRLGP